jgi:hypothetical protein
MEPIRSFLITVCVFLVFIPVHIGVHKTLRNSGIITFLSGAIFFIGFIFLSVYFFSSVISKDFSGFPLTMTIIYILLAADYMVEIATPVLGDESPSAKILYLLQKKIKMNKDQIVSRFSDDRLIGKRLTDLIGSEMISFSGKKYFILPAGNKIMNLIIVFRKMMRMENAG